MMKLIISLITCVFLLIGFGFGIYVWHWEDRPHVLEIYCFALDKNGASPGNLAVFIRTPNGQSILIDGGKSSSILSALTSAMPFYRRSINTIISTNPDDAHITGLVNVIDRYHVDQVIEASTTVVKSLSTTSSAYNAFEDTISNSKIKHDEVSAGDVIDFGDPALSMGVVFPPALPGNSSSSFPFSKTNIPVLVFEIKYGSTEVFFGGDISKKEQAYIASSSSLVAGNGSSTLLILPHAENVGVPDEAFFKTLNPTNVIVIKNPVSAAPKKSRSTSKESASSTKKTTKAKPPKIPFNIEMLSDTSITNLVSDGDVEFISNGQSFSEKKL